MNYKEFNVALPIRDNNVLVIDGVVQYDTANIINARLMDGTEPFDFTGYTEVFIEIVKPDGTHIQACVTDDVAVNNDNNPYHIQIVDAKDGRVSFTLHSQATILTGTHFGQIMIAGDGKVLTSARINYYVGDTLSQDTDPDSVSSSDDYVSLKNMIAKNSAMGTAERQREDNETQRKLAEIAREKRAEDQAQYVQNYIDNAKGYVDQTEDFMDLARQSAQLDKNPSKEIMQALITELSWVDKSYVDSEVAQETKDFDAGAYTDTSAKKLLKVRRGLAADEPTLEVGELGFSTDSKIMYIGSATGNLPVSGIYKAQATAPAETHILWIDTSTAGGGAIKYHDGTGWEPTATATFA